MERETEEEKKNIKIIRIADPSIFERSHGESIADKMSPGYYGRTRGISFNPADNTRIPGKMEVHERLRFNKDGIPGMYVFSTCEDWIRTVPNLPYNTRKTGNRKHEDIDTLAEDHDYDATRYFLMEHPLKATKKERKQPRVYSPFDN